MTIVAAIVIGKRGAVVEVEIVESSRGRAVVENMIAKFVRRQ